MILCRDPWEIRVQGACAPLLKTENYAGVHELRAAVPAQTASETEGGRNSPHGAWKEAGLPQCGCRFARWVKVSRCGLGFRGLVFKLHHECEFNIVIQNNIAAIAYAMIINKRHKLRIIIWNYAKNEIGSYLLPAGSKINIVIKNAWVLSKYWNNKHRVSIV